MPRSKSTAKNAAPTTPAWHTTATVLIILHLFCLGVGLVANSGGGKSLLAPALRQIPLAREYLQLLWMDIGYDVHLASPLPEDGVHSVELAIDGDAAPDDVGLPLELPPPGLEPRIRRQRYQELAYHVAYFDELFADNSDLRTELPLAIAGQWLRELKAPPRSYQLVCRCEPAARLPKAVERAPSKPREGGPRLAGPTLYAPETFTVHLVWNPDEGHYQASRSDPPGQMSQVVRPTTATDAAPPADDDSTEQPADAPAPGAPPAGAEPPAKGGAP